MTKQRIRVLSIEDNPAEARLIQAKIAMAQRTGWNLPHFEIEHVTRVKAALERLEKGGIDVVLSDLDLPDSQAGDTVATLREHIPHMPLVVLTGREDEDLARKSVRAGVQDYLYKAEATGSLLIRAMMYAIERQQARAQLEQRVKERTADLRAEIAGDITEIKRTEEALRTSEERFRALFEQAQIGIALVDREARIQTANPYMCRWLGYPEEEILKLTIEEITHPQDWGREQTLIRELREKKRDVVRLEKRYIKKSGEPVWGDLVTNIVRDEQGNYLFGLGTVVDITAQKQTEEALRKSEALLERSQRIASVGSWIFHAATSELTWTDEVYRIFGVARRDFQPTYETFLERVHPEDRAAVDAAFSESLREGRNTYEIEHRVIRKDTGEIRFVHEKGEHVRDTAGRVVRSVGMVQDITQSKRIEEALRESQERLELALRGGALGTWDWNTQTDEVRFNARWAEMLGYRLEEIEPHLNTWKRLVHPDDLPGVHEKLDAHLEGKIPFYEAEFRMRHKSGEWIWVLDRGKVIERDEKGRPLRACGTHLDITERKRAEEKLERYAADLERSNKELEQFGHVISHDLREPARMVRSYLNLLARRYRGQLNEEADEFIDYAVDGAERMQEMIDALLNLSRVETKGREPAPTEVEVILKRTLKSLSRAIEEAGAEVTYDPLPTVMADPAQLAQVFQNLIANAIKFRREDSIPRVHIAAERENSAWLFSVADNGIGIDPQYTDRLFQIFQRLHRREEYEGTGIGLALCRRIVERHGGRIWFESKPGEGSTFYFTLPALLDDRP